MINKKLLIIDEYTGSYNDNNIGNEYFNNISSDYDGNYYVYIPPKNTIDLKRLGADAKDQSIDNILVIFTKKINEKSIERVITDFYPSATIN